MVTALLYSVAQLESTKTLSLTSYLSKAHAATVSVKCLIYLIVNVSRSIESATRFGSSLDISCSYTSSLHCKTKALDVDVVSLGRNELTVI